MKEFTVDLTELRGFCFQGLRSWLNIKDFTFDGNSMNSSSDISLTVWLEHEMIMKMIPVQNQAPCYLWRSFEVRYLVVRGIYPAQLNVHFYFHSTYYYFHFDSFMIELLFFDIKCWVPNEKCFSKFFSIYNTAWEM